MSRAIWWWGGALALALATRQVALGLLPLVVWQRRTLQQQFQDIHQRLHRLELQTAPQVQDMVQQQGQQLNGLLGQVQAIAAQLENLQNCQGISHTHPLRAVLQQQLQDIHRRLHRLELQTAPQVQDTVQRLDQLQQRLDQLARGMVMRQGVGVFIDGANLHESARRLEAYLDYRQLLHRLLPPNTAAEIHFYSGHYPHHPQQQQLYRELQRLGVRVHTKPVTCFADGGRKANLDGQMMVDMLTGLFAQVILLSGDGDFLPALLWLKQQGVQVTVAAFAPYTHHRLKTDFAFRDLRKLCAAGGQVVPLPAKQTPAVAG